MRDKPEIEFDEFMRVVAMTPEAAQRFAGRIDIPVDLGPAERADHKGNPYYRDGARVFGFRRPESNDSSATDE